MAQLQEVRFGIQSTRFPGNLGSMELILDWSDQAANKSLAEILRSDFKALLVESIPETSGVEFEAVVQSAPTPIAAREQGTRTLSSPDGIDFPIQSRRNYWGRVEFNSVNTKLGRVHPIEPSSGALRLALRLIAERLDQAHEREALGSALHRLSHVAGAAVHEVRNPLTSLRLQLHLLERTLGTDRGPSHQLVADMEAEMQRISWHLEDLSTVTQFKAGKFALNPTRIDLVSSIREVVSRHARLFELRNTSCSFTSKESEILGRWDAFRVEQVVGNLLSNAWKYGNSRPVEVSLEIQGSDPVRCFPRTCGAKSCCVIRVRDHGRGMDEESTAHIFDGFFRAKGADHQRGTGLGLYVSLNLLKSMGGTLTVKSKIGEGSEFIACIPRSL